ncbi:MAG: gfo/Idh/MocA family oxidoreductase, partial [Lentisphaerae bacterium]|nr:gfo/Idh/MocA family oxidoreductase [Lentisphaerota bacterium]
MMFETSYYHSDLYAMRKIYEAGGFGELVYSEGQYFHYSVHTLDSHKGWRVGIPPQWYPTHATAYHVGVTRGSFTEVSCMAMPSILDDFQPGKNAYGNIFDTEIALFRTSEGGMARMGVSWGTQGAGTESGHVRGQRGTWNVLTGKYEGEEENLPELRKPQLPPGMDEGGHGGSHGDLGNEFVSSIIEERTPEIDIAMALNMTVPGVIAHRSACKGGELLKIPQYSFDRV